MSICNKTSLHLFFNSYHIMIRDLIIRRQEGKGRQSGYGFHQCPTRSSRLHGWKRSLNVLCQNISLSQQDLCPSLSIGHSVNTSCIVYFKLVPASILWCPLQKKEKRWSTRLFDLMSDLTNLSFSGLRVNGEIRGSPPRNVKNRGSPPQNVTDRIQY